MKNKQSGFTLVELMIFFVFLTLILAASTPIITKRVKNPPVRVQHGSFICTANKDGAKYLQERYNSTKRVESKMVDECKFEPPKKADIFKIEIIGAGVGGKNLHRVDEEIEQREATYTYPVTPWDSTKAGHPEEDKDNLYQPLTNEQVQYFFKKNPNVRFWLAVATGDAEDGKNLSYSDLTNDQLGDKGIKKPATTAKIELLNGDIPGPQGNALPTDNEKKFNQYRHIHELLNEDSHSTYNNIPNGKGNENSYRVYTDRTLEKFIYAATQDPQEPSMPYPRIALVYDSDNLYNGDFTITGTTIDSPYKADAGKKGEGRVLYASNKLFDKPIPYDKTKQYLEELFTKNVLIGHADTNAENGCGNFTQIKQNEKYDEPFNIKLDVTEDYKDAAKMQKIIGRVFAGSESPELEGELARKVFAEPSKSVINYAAIKYFDKCFTNKNPAQAGKPAYIQFPVNTENDNTLLDGQYDTNTDYDYIVLSQEHDDLKGKDADRVSYKNLPDNMTTALGNDTLERLIAFPELLIQTTLNKRIHTVGIGGSAGKYEVYYTPNLTDDCKFIIHPGGKTKGSFAHSSNGQVVEDIDYDYEALNSKLSCNADTQVYTAEGGKGSYQPDEEHDGHYIKPDEYKIEYDGFGKYDIETGEIEPEPFYQTLLKGEPSNFKMNNIFVKKSVYKDGKFGQGGNGTTIKDHCSNHHGFYDVYAQYIDHNRNLTTDPNSGNPNKFLEKFVIPRKECEVEYQEATPGYGGAIIISW